jgi:cytochrome c553
VINKQYVDFTKSGGFVTMPRWIGKPLFDAGPFYLLRRNFMKLFSTVVLASVIAVSGQALAGDAGAGKSAYAAKGCIGCHGAGGKSVVPTYPSLVGKGEAYVKENLTNFRSGKRVNATMNAMSAGLSDADIDNLATYLGGL